MPKMGLSRVAEGEEAEKESEGLGGYGMNDTTFRASNPSSDLTFACVSEA